MTKAPFQNLMVRAEAGKTVYTEGDLGATMYIVQSGKIRLSRGKDAQEGQVAVLEKGDFFGEMSILEGLPRGDTAVAVDESELIEIDSAAFTRMMRGNIEIAIRVMRKLSVRLREAERKIEELKTRGPGAAAVAKGPAASTPKPSGSTVTGLRLDLEDGSRAFPLNPTETVVGRFDPVTDLTPDVDLSDVDLKRTVSRSHARILKTSEGYAVVEEVGALNGTSVNGEALTAGQPHPIADGDRLDVGSVRLVFRT